MLYINTWYSLLSYGQKDSYAFLHKSPTPGHKCTRENTCCWGNFRPSESAGGPMFTLIIHPWYFCTRPAARWCWCLLLSTGGSGPSWLQKPKCQLTSRPGNHGPRAMIFVLWDSLSDLITPPLGRWCYVLYWPSAPSRSLLKCKGQSTAEKVFFPMCFKPSTFSSLSLEIRERKEDDFAANLFSY